MCLRITQEEMVSPSPGRDTMSGITVTRVHELVHHTMNNPLIIEGT